MGILKSFISKEPVTVIETKLEYVLQMHRKQPPLLSSWGALGSPLLAPFPHPSSLTHTAWPGICTPAVQTGHIFPLRTFWMFSRNLQSFDYTHTVRLNVTFPTGDCPTWVQLLHLVFLFVLEKAPATFGQHSSCWPCLWDHFSPTQSSRGCSL